MSENVDTELLVNCTILAVKRFELTSIVNTSELNNLNRSDIIGLLSGIIENKDNLERINDAKDFLTECLFLSPTRPYKFPWEQKTIWATIFGVMLLVAIAGYSIVLWIVTATNYFLLNLSIADLLMSSLNCIFNFIFMLNSDWPFGMSYFIINNFMANVSVSTSVFTLVGISFHRSDTEAELKLVKSAAIKAGAYAAAVCTHWSDGGRGCLELADAVINVCKESKKFKLLYEDEMSLLDKMNTIAQKMYGAAKVELTPEAQNAMDKLTKAGFGNLPVCMSKTSGSSTGDAAIKGAPKGFTLTISKMYVSAGAGFVVAMCGKISKMPGLHTRPSIYDIDLNTKTGEIEGLF